MSAALTLILGPQSTGGLALNQFIREQGRALGRAGVHAMPLRRAAPLVRRMTDTARPYRDRKAEFNSETKQRPAVLAALNSFGSPDAAVTKGEFFPAAEETLGPVGKIGGLCDAVLVIEPLHHLFLASGSARLEARARATPWEVLFEMSWADLARRVLDRMKAARLLVLTPLGMATRSPEVMERVFGPEVAGLADPYWLMRRAMNDTGVAVLERLLVQGTPPVSTLKEVYGSFVALPSPEDIEARLGIEKITARLLEQRFEEDRSAIARMPRAEVI